MVHVTCGFWSNHQAATPYLKQLDLEVELPDENLEYSKNLCELDVALILGVLSFCLFIWPTAQKDGLL